MTPLDIHLAVWRLHRSAVWLTNGNLAPNCCCNQDAARNLLVPAGPHLPLEAASSYIESAYLGYRKQSNEIRKTLLQLLPLLEQTERQVLSAGNTLCSPPYRQCSSPISLTVAVIAPAGPHRGRSLGGQARESEQAQTGEKGPCGVVMMPALCSGCEDGGGVISFSFSCVLLFSCLLRNRSLWI